MTSSTFPYPALEQKHLANAKLFASRSLMVASFDQLKPNKIIAEIGVAIGDFSDYMIRTLKPKEFVAFDLFEIHTWPNLWGKTPTELFGAQTHLEFYQERFKDQNVVTRVGKSADTLKEYPDQYFDMIYIDADHRYEAVKADALLSLKKVKDDGILIFNDYILFDHISRQPYGIVQVVNELVVQNNYEVIGYALDPNMFCDIAIKKHA